MEQMHTRDVMTNQTRGMRALARAEMVERWETADVATLRERLVACMPRSTRIRRVVVVVGTLEQSVRIRACSGSRSDLAAVGCAVRWCRRLDAPVLFDLVHGCVSTMTLPRVQRDEGRASYHIVTPGTEHTDVVLALPLSSLHPIGHVVVELAVGERPDWETWIRTFNRMRSALDLGLLAPTQGSSVDAVRSLARSREPLLLSGPDMAELRRQAFHIHAISGMPEGIEVLDPTGSATAQLASLSGFVQRSGHETRGHLDRVGEGTLLMVNPQRWCDEVQSLLAEVLRRRAYRVIGDGGYRPLNARPIAMISDPLDVALRDGSLRPELWHELATFMLRVDPTGARSYAAGASRS